MEEHLQTELRITSVTSNWTYKSVKNK